LIAVIVVVELQIDLVVHDFEAVGFVAGSILQFR
jgi:hypothetical protein